MPRLQRLAPLLELPGTYWLVVGVATIFTLARFSEAFLLLRANQVGLRVMLVPAVLVVMNVVYSLAAYPAGGFWLLPLMMSAGILGGMAWAAIPAVLLGIASLALLPSRPAEATFLSPEQKAQREAYDMAEKEGVIDPTTFFIGYFFPRS